LRSFAEGVQSPNNKKNLRKTSIRNPLSCSGMPRFPGKTRPRPVIIRELEDAQQLMIGRDGCEQATYSFSGDGLKYGQGKESSVSFEVSE
jgi:hypothetical protein